MEEKIYITTVGEYDDEEICLVTRDKERAIEFAKKTKLESLARAKKANIKFWLGAPTFVYERTLECEGLEDTDCIWSSYEDMEENDG